MKRRHCDRARRVGQPSLVLSSDLIISQNYGKDILRTNKALRYERNPDDCAFLLAHFILI